MKTVGLIGGIGCFSTMVYYKTIIERISFLLGKGHTGNLVIFSIDEYEIIEPLKRKEWDRIASVMKQVTTKVDKSGADFIIICSNTFHRFYDTVQENTKRPVIHILLPTCLKINKQNFQKIGLIGTSTTLLQNYYSDYLLKNSSANEIIKPNLEQIETIERIIFTELFNNELMSHSKKALLGIVQSLVDRGAQCVILGCTEFSLILSQKDFTLPVFDTTHMHATYAADYMIEGKNI